MKNLVALAYRTSFSISRIQPIKKPEPSKLKEYYQQLLSTAAINNNGRLRIHEPQIATFINLINEKDIKAAIEAFNNLLGHNLAISLRLFDRYVTKCIEYNEIEYSLEIMRHHSTLSYFPSKPVVEALVARLKDDQIETFAEILRKSPLLKVDQEVLEKMLRDDPKICHAVFSVAVERKLPLSPESLYRIARNFAPEEEAKKAEAMLEFAAKLKNDDAYSHLSMAYTHFRLKNNEQTIVALVRAKELGAEVVKRELPNLQSLLDQVKDQVKDDDKWSGRVNDLLSKL